MGRSRFPDPRQDSSPQGMNNWFRYGHRGSRMGDKRTAICLGLALLLAPIGHAAAEAEDGDSGPLPNALYEVTENVNFSPVNGIKSRNATSALLGTVALGTPLCSSEALEANPGTKACTILATGSDEISLLTGFGAVSGQYSVVVNAPGNSAVHVPDCPVESGRFEGTIDFRHPLQGIPIASVTGTFSRTTTFVSCTVPTPVSKATPVTFLGTFRLPFGVDRWGHAAEPETGARAFYLGDDGQLIPVESNERDLGFPLVRLEIHF
jgi:hypothetical protein